MMPLLDPPIISSTPNQPLVPTTPVSSFKISTDIPHSENKSSELLRGSLGEWMNYA